MARFYQNVLTGQQVEVKTFEEEDFYLENQANWCRIKALSVPPVANGCPPDHPAPPAAASAVKKPAKKT
jgi:hypothetical protein